MEDKTLTTEQSLDLIARMLENTRRNFNDRGGAMFLIWGYTTIAVTLAVYIAFSLTKSYDVMWLWWALPLVAGILTWLHFRKHKRSVQTHLDKNVWSVWIVFSVATMACMVFGFIPATYRFPILFTIGLLISMATAITGLMIKFRPVAVGGFAGIVLSFVILFPDGMIEQFIAFAMLFLPVQVIPSHLLNTHCKREARETRETREAKNGRAE
jgi:ABC-type multidrug transport system fused ATPase/permease subunit